MSYNINLTNGTQLTSILDGTVNTTTGLTLIGRNYVGYGTFLNDNFVHLLENFASNSSPTISSSATAPLTGTLWYDTGNSALKVYDGTEFSLVSPLNATALATINTKLTNITSALHIVANLTAGIISSNANVSTLQTSLTTLINSL